MNVQDKLASVIVKFYWVLFFNPITIKFIKKVMLGDDAPIFYFSSAKYGEKTKVIRGTGWFLIILYTKVVRDIEKRQYISFSPSIFNLNLETIKWCKTL